MFKAIRKLFMTKEQRKLLCPEFRQDFYKNLLYRFEYTYRVLKALSTEYASTMTPCSEELVPDVFLCHIDRDSWYTEHGVTKRSCFDNIDWKTLPESLELEGNPTYTSVKKFSCKHGCFKDNTQRRKFLEKCIELAGKQIEKKDK